MAPRPPTAHRGLGLLTAALACTVAPVPPDSHALTASPCDLGANVVYNGGPVLQSVQVTALFWRDAVETLRPPLDDFFSGITQSPFLDWLTEYNAPGQPIGRGNYLGSLSLSAAPAPETENFKSTLSDATIQAEIQELLRSGQITSSPSALFFVFMPPSTIITDPQNRTSTGNFDGYHNSFNDDGDEIFYAVIPDPIASAAEHGLSVLDFVTLVSSHELSEAITDPSVLNGAWYDPNLGEIGDICAWRFPPGRVEGFAVQREWSNAQRACVDGPPPLGLEACGPICSDPSSDPANCGGCGNVCTPQQTCFASVCHGSTSTAQPDPCAGADLTSDPFNCGACNAVCNAESVCAQSSCQACQVGLIACANACTDPSSDPDNCGGCDNPCAVGQTCADGACAGCASGLTACGSTCTDTTSDPYNCAGCGNVCPSGLCQGSACAPCGDGLTACGTECTDTDVDSANCGGCGDACGDAGACQAGSCQGCPGAQTDCGGGCTDTTSDPDNCGGCGQGCDPTSFCDGGGCEECGFDLIGCSNSCVDPSGDPNNCGGCGGTCASDEACVIGLCEVDCDGGLIACDGGCTDPTSDPDNCGGCGNSCDAGSCADSVCQ